MERAWRDFSCINIQRVFYTVAQAIIRFAIRCFYRLQTGAFPRVLEGPWLLLANHPNSLMDPVLVVAASPRPLTFLAKAPLFSLPILGSLLKAAQALPVYRKQDDASQMNKNAATFDAACAALREGRALMLFPEGRSHSEPSLGEIKTGAARIALQAFRQGIDVQFLPVGLTYAEKDRFRSEAKVEAGEPFRLQDVLGIRAAQASADDEVAQVQQLTQRIADGLHDVTLNLDAWEDLPLLKVAEQLYALQNQAPKDDTRLRTFARGARRLRDEQPERYTRVRRKLLAFQRRLALLEATPSDLTLRYRVRSVLWFAFRNLIALCVGFPLFGLGAVVWGLPFFVARLLPLWMKSEKDMIATVTFLAMMLFAPLWWLVLVTTAGFTLGVWAAVLTAITTPGLAAFTRYFFERRRVAIQDTRTFFILGSRVTLRSQLIEEGHHLAREVGQLVNELS